MRRAFIFYLIRSIKSKCSPLGNISGELEDRVRDLVEKSSRLGKSYAVAVKSLLVFKTAQKKDKCNAKHTKIAILNIYLSKSYFNQG